MVIKSSKQQAAAPLTQDDLVGFFTAWEKPRAAWRVGIEQESLAMRADGSTVPYRGRDGIAAMLEALKKPGDTLYREGAHIIGLARPHDNVSIEPGGQLELATVPAASVRLVATEIERHVRLLRTVGEPLNMYFIYGGFRPFGSLAEVSWLPKQRYRIMRRYLPTRGKLAHEMMKRTATQQPNFDFASEADAGERMRTALAVTSVVTAMSAASPISGGKPNGYQTYRAHVWTQTDEDRCGVLPFAFQTKSIYRGYTDWALDVPMFFIERNGATVPARGCTFRRFMFEGLEGHTATMDDWALHLSTLFPEVRMKRTIELRGSDAAPVETGLAVAALWRGLLDDVQARAEVWDLVSDVPVDERLKTRLAVPRAGLSAYLGRHRVGDLAVRLCQIAREALGRLAATVPGGDDRDFLDPLEESVAAGRTPADAMLEDLEATGGDPASLVQRWRH